MPIGMELIKELERQGKELQAQNRGTEASHNTAKYLFAFIYLYQEHIASLNEIKAKLDAALQANDTETFQKELWAFKNIVSVLTPAKSALKSRRKQKRLKIHSDLFLNTINKIAYLENTITGGERWLKESSMSPAQRAAAKRASVRMQMRWGM